MNWPGRFWRHRVGNSHAPWTFGSATFCRWRCNMREAINRRPLVCSASLRAAFPGKYRNTDCKAESGKPMLKRTRAKTTSAFGAHSGSRPIAPIASSRGRGRIVLCQSAYSTRCRSCERRVWLFPLPWHDDRVPHLHGWTLWRCNALEGIANESGCRPG